MFGVLNMLVSVASFLPILIVGPIADLRSARRPCHPAGRAPGRRRRGSPRSCIRGPLAPAETRARGPTSARTATRSSTALGAEMPEGAYDIDDDDEDGAGGVTHRSRRRDRRGAPGPFAADGQIVAEATATGETIATGDPAATDSDTADPHARELTVATGRGRVHRRDDQHAPRPGRRRQRPGPRRRGDARAGAGPRRDRRRRPDRPRPDAGQPFHVPGAVRDLWSAIRARARRPVDRRRRRRPGHRHDRGDRVLLRPAPRRRRRRSS